MTTNNPTNQFDPDGRSPAHLAIILGACHWLYGECILHLSDIGDKADLAIVALSIFWNFDDTREGSQGDALQHCIGACMAKQDDGPCWAWQVEDYVDFLESPLIGGEHADSGSDLGNNTVGFAMKGDCAEGCMKALNNGELFCLSPDGTTFACHPAQKADLDPPLPPAPAPAPSPAP